MNALSPTASPAAAQSSPVNATAPASATPSKDTFLKLLVAQIKNQNPLSPSDGAQFLAQLAQFSQLEQLVSIREGVESLRAPAAAAQ